MTTKSTSLSFSELKTKATVLSSNMKLNVEKISRYGIELPAFTNEMDADLLQADVLNNEQERLKSELKAKTEELNALMLKLEKNYALGTYSGAYPPINSGRIKSARAAIKSVIPADMHPF